MKTVECTATWNEQNVFVAIPQHWFFYSAEQLFSDDSDIPEDAINSIPVFIDNNGELIMVDVSLGELTDLVVEGTHIPTRSCTKRHFCNREEKNLFPAECTTCNSYEARKKATKEGKQLPFYIVAYGINRCYGGPEEGGWYYDTSRILEVRKVYSLEAGLKAARELKEEYPTCKRGRFSVIGGEDTYLMVCYTEEQFPQEGPNTKPRYE